MTFNPTIIKDSAPTESWWAKKLTREEWAEEHRRQVDTRMRLSSVVVPFGPETTSPIMLKRAVDRKHKP